MPIQITLSLSHYFSHTKQRGQRFSVVSKELADTITAQENWEKECFIEELPGNDKIVRLWILEDWLFHKENNMELVAEAKHDNLVNAAKYHNDLEAWKNTVRSKLRLAGKLNEQQISKVITAAVSPVNVNDFEIRNKLVSKYPFEFKS